MAISAAMRGANRANAQRSTGPRTAAGKAAARLNALKHGMTGRTVLLPGEDEAEFAALEADLAARFFPEGELERESVREMAAALWRLGRAPRAEAVALLLNADDELLEDHPAAAAFASEGAIDILLRISRYEAQVRRSFERARERLALLKQARAFAEAQADEAAVRPAPATPREAPASNSPPQKPQFRAGDGFVSSIPPRPPSGRLARALLASASPLPLHPPSAFALEGSFRSSRALGTVSPGC